jgi:hypothetical protein
VSARPLGPVWLAPAVSGLAVADVDKAREIVRARPHWTSWAGGLVLLAGTANLAWILLRVPNPPTPTHSAVQRLWLGVQNVPVILKELVGFLGRVDTPLPSAAYDVWWALAPEDTDRAPGLGVGRGAHGGQVPCRVAACQLSAFLTNAHRYGIGKLAMTYDLHRATWHPYGGWPLWLVVGTLGGLLIAASGFGPRHLDPSQATSRRVVPRSSGVDGQ